jgi:myo-inositol-1(or 4)-monophosphatase
MDGLLNKVIAIAREAGRIMLTERNVSVDTKGTKENYVTSTDVKIQSFLRKELTTILAHSEFMGEEEDLPSAGNEKIDRDAYVWVVDPIDGTANYARHIPISTVSIALVKDNESVLGVVYQPNLDEIYYAEKGKGAFLNGERIHVSDRKLENCMLCTAWSCYNKKRAPLCFAVTERLYYLCEDIRRIGTAAYELCQLARGSADLYFEINLSPWDYAGAACIVREAGGHLSSNTRILGFYAPCPVLGANTAENAETLRKIVIEEDKKHPETEISFNG